MKIERLAFRLFAALGIQPTPPTPIVEVRRLIARLRPRTTVRGLLRLGPDGDGGYLIPDDLYGIDACFSPGVSDVAGFEKDCAARGMQVFMADASVAAPPDEHPDFHFVPRFIGAVTDDRFMTLDDWVAESMPGSTSDLLLQMDIEGAEYETILSASPALLRRFRIIVAEFHHLQALFSAPFFAISSRAFEKILQTHTCVHIHPNNLRGSVTRGGIEIPRVMEFTFLRSDRVRDAGCANAFPHPLDRRNVAGADLVLPKCWYVE